MSTTTYTDKHGVKHYGVMARAVRQREQDERRKILISREYGAGWSSWCQGGSEEVIFMLTFGPLIEAVEKGEPVGCLGCYPDIENFFLPETDEDGRRVYDMLSYHRAMCEPGSPLDQFVVAYAEKFGIDYLPYLEGAENLSVVEVDRPFRVMEYDGREHIEYLDQAAYIDPATL